jgi:hypothetical protein
MNRLNTKYKQEKSMNLIRLILFFIFSGITMGYSQSFFEKLKDSTDNALDLSYFLKDLHGILPIVSPITEPAVGYGAAAAMIYFISKDREEGKKWLNSDMAGIAGGYTQNGTWFLGGGYLGFWNEDKVRYRGVLGYGDVNLKYYSKPIFGDKERSVEFNISSSFLLQQVIVRIHNSNFFLGGKYTFAKTHVEFSRHFDFPEIKPRDFELTNSGVSLISEYENLNNVLSPTKGMRIHLSYDQNLEILGSDRNWGKVNFFSHFYFPVSRNWVPALRLESQISTGDAPFYAKPFVFLRGVPAMRYQGDLTLVAETEQLININSRWGIVGFTGLGTAFHNLEDMNAGDLVWNAGGGFRYLIAKLFGLKMGIDVARGPEEWAVYVVFGSGWLR